MREKEEKLTKPWIELETRRLDGDFPMLGLHCDLDHFLQVIDLIENLWREVRPETYKRFQDGGRFERWKGLSPSLISDGHFQLTEGNLRTDITEDGSQIHIEISGNHNPVDPKAIEWVDNRLNNLQPKNAQ